MSRLPLLSLRICLSVFSVRCYEGQNLNQLAMQTYKMNEKYPLFEQHIVGGEQPSAKHPVIKDIGKFHKAQQTGYSPNEAKGSQKRGSSSIRFPLGLKKTPKRLKLLPSMHKNSLTHRKNCPRPGRRNAPEKRDENN